MKRKKTLFIFFLIIILLSVISLWAFKNKGGDFLNAVSSLSNDFIVIISMITIVYSLITYSVYIKDKILDDENNYHKYVTVGLLMLLLTLVIIFLSYATVFSHKNIIDFLIETLINNKNSNVISAFIKSLIIYYYIYLSSVNGIVINYRVNKDENIYSLPITIVLIGILLLLAVYFIFNGLILIICILDIFLYLLGSLLWNVK